eukprot:TRINITY_DN22618_c0_g1_i2.p1 TRINITY_DN22618_c0_g1~~TRINITY_DN22618_c0_g1_i2.p1  ORF type:complete len:227 (+),score=39.41 TRINITY_DN22618_c0_g1_i2:129-809(+)
MPPRSRGRSIASSSAPSLTGVSVRSDATGEEVEGMKEADFNLRAQEAEAKLKSNMAFLPKLLAETRAPYIAMDQDISGRGLNASGRDGQHWLLNPGQYSSLKGDEKETQKEIYVERKAWDTEMQKPVPRHLHRLLTLDDTMDCSRGRNCRVAKRRPMQTDESSDEAAQREARNLFLRLQRQNAQDISDGDSETEVPLSESIARFDQWMSRHLASTTPKKQGRSAVR